MQRGFSLVETVIGASLLAAALVTLAQLLATAVQSGAAARTATVTAIIAEQNMEELRTLSWSMIAALGSGTDYVDAAGKETCLGATMPCADAVYLRRWSATPALFSSGVLIIEAHAAALGKGHGSATLITARTRMSQ